MDRYKRSISKKNKIYRPYTLDGIGNFYFSPSTSNTYHAWRVRSSGDDIADVVSYVYNSYGIWCDYIIPKCSKILVVKIAEHDLRQLRLANQPVRWRRRHQRRQCQLFLRAKFNNLARRARIIPAATRILFTILATSATIATAVSVIPTGAYNRRARIVPAPYVSYGQMVPLLSVTTVSAVPTDIRSPGTFIISSNDAWVVCLRPVTSSSSVSSTTIPMGENCRSRIAMILYAPCGLMMIYMVMIVLW